MHEVEQLFAELAGLDAVEAIALGGSRAGGHFDEKSDYDVYLYVTQPVPEAARRRILSAYCGAMEIGNHFWEAEDNCTLHDGVDIDILYRSLDDFTRDVASVVEGFQARNGYTTCMWHNLRTCRIVYDRDGRLAAAKRRFDVAYPEPLRASIIERNMRLLSGSLPSYDAQLGQHAEMLHIDKGLRLPVQHQAREFTVFHDQPKMIGLLSHDAALRGILPLLMYGKALRVQHPCALHQRVILRLQPNDFHVVLLTARAQAP